jgi:hypothetical protein
VSLFLLAGGVAFALNASEFDSLAFAMSTQRKVVPTPYFAYVTAIFLAFCNLASLKFMKDVRQDKSA